MKIGDNHDCRCAVLCKSPQGRLTAKDAEIARLRAELAGLRAEHGSVVRGWQTYEKRTAEAARRDAEEIARLREVLNRYRYAHAFAGADSWDGGPDMRHRLEWAHSSDEGRFLTADQIAAIGKTFPDRAALASDHTP